MNHSYFLIGIKTGKLFSMLSRNGGFSVRYILRVLMLFASSIWSSIFAARERHVYKERIASTEPSTPPIFIIGHWRTGTTFLHQLLSVDDQFSTPSVFQVSVPEGFLVSRKYYYPIMTKALGDKRPIDNVKIGFDEPQEDEYALLKTTKSSPLEDLIFPKNKDFFLSKFENYIPEEKNKPKWKKELVNFYKKLNISSGKQILFKNPFHSLRIPLLLEIFPNAKFIHIYRNPEKVVPSAVKMWNTVGTQNALRTGWQLPDIKSVAECYKKIILYIRKESEKIPEDQYIEIKFEEFEKDSITHIRKIYSQLKLNYTEEYSNKLMIYLDELKDYKKGSYSISEVDKESIKEVLIETLPEYY